MNTPAHDLHDLTQLQRLRELREAAARRACAELRRARDEAVVAIAQRQQAIHLLRRDIAAQARHLVGEGATALPQLSGMAAAHREWLDDRLERAEYALIDDEDALEAAEARLAEAEAALRRCSAQCQAVQDLRADARRRLLRLQDQKLERELEPQRRHPLTGAWA